MAGLGLTSLGPSWQLAGWAIAGVGVLTTLVVLFVLPDNVRSWDTGAAGELRTAEALAELDGSGFVVLHDRKIARSAGNIDHIVIGPPGVFVVETKNYGGEIRVRSGDLFVGRRRRTGVINQVTRQASVVSQALDGIPVERIVCVHRADFPLLSKPKLGGVPIVDRRGLLRLLREAPVRLTEEEVQRVAVLAHTRLRPAA